ncbi:DUF6082 family protein [Dactylosporangium sp. CS-047395]|uniref:DUF6082 family protein n=1 Tax=Dactylosporangium sp. CS-047395 TaxID=3239936 RepID=UPI003D8BEA7E
MSKWIRASTFLLSFLVILFLLIELPFIFDLLGGTTESWNRLSLIGQAYGSVSAIISAVALAGVVVSLNVQRQQTRIAAQYNFRQQHFSLMKAALDDPALMACLGFNRDVDPERRRQLVYINMLTAFWYSAWLVGDLRDAELVANLKHETFTTDMGLLWWERAREFRVVAHEQDLSRFDRIVEQVYQEALASLCSLSAAFISSSLRNLSHLFCAKG